MIDMDAQLAAAEIHRMKNPVIMINPDDLRELLDSGAGIMYCNHCCNHVFRGHPIQSKKFVKRGFLLLKENG
jgi:hypothetical protein